MFKLVFTFFTLIFLTGNVWSQNRQLELVKKWRSPDGRNIDFYYVSDNKNPDEIPNLKTVGSPYIHQDFQPAVIYTIHGEVFDGLVMRYNAYLDLMEFKEFITDDDTLISYLNKTPKLMFKIGTQIYDFVPGSGKVENGTYYEVLFRGTHVSLYKKTHKKFTEGRIARTSYETDFPRRYKDSYTYYFVNPNGKLKEFKGSEKKFLNTLNLKEVELQKYIQQQKINHNEEQGYIKIVSYLDSLL